MASAPPGPMSDFQEERETAKACSLASLVFGHGKECGTPASLARAELHGHPKWKGSKIGERLAFQPLSKGKAREKSLENGVERAKVWCRQFFS